MDDLVERDDSRDLLPIQRCRELLGDEALGLTEDDLDAIADTLTQWRTR